jgi:MipA family protein
VRAWRDAASFQAIGRLRDADERAAGLLRACARVAALGALLHFTPACAEPPGLSSLIVPPAAAGLGVAMRTQRSPYEGAGTRYDLLPLYLYEGERVYLRSTRVGLKLWEASKHQIALILEQRLEGFPADDVPESLAGMEGRDETVDFGLTYRYRARWGTLQAELVHDVTGESNGTELRLGYYFDWMRGRLVLRPSAMLGARSANLNDYYYGVRPEEATGSRPAYSPGADFELWVGVHASYRLLESWRVLASLGLLLAGREVRDSPIVRDGVEPTALLGVAYDFKREQMPSREGWPFYLKVLYGQSTGCILADIATFGCTAIDTGDRTDIAAVEVGIPFAQRVGGWPLDFVGYVGALRHLERNLQPDFWQLNAYMKAFYYGFPWSHRVRTRIGLGAGLSLAERVPHAEAGKRVPRDERTSELLNYLDPTIDINLGDLLRPRRELYLGLGVSHRSGIFGASQTLGNVSGGSNYIYTYIEARL